MLCDGDGASFAHTPQDGTCGRCAVAQLVRCAPYELIAIGICSLARSQRLRLISVMPAMAGRPSVVGSGTAIAGPDVEVEIDRAWSGGVGLA